MKRYYRIVKRGDFYYPQSRLLFWFWRPLPRWGWHIGYEETCSTRAEAQRAIDAFD